jgi:hypothetical protein
VTSTAEAANVAKEPPFNWDRLIREIRFEQVIPIVGPELLPYHRTLAPRLAEELGLPGQPPFTDIRAVADEYLKRSGSGLSLESALGRLLEEDLVIPPALRQLAQIEQFRLFVTTDYASLLETALSKPLGENQQQSRPPSCQTLAFAQKRAPDDLREYPPKEHCAVYHLLGHSQTAGARMAVARVQQLEYFYALQTEQGPRQLLDILKERRNLLFLGCDFPDWLAGFFTRTLLGKPFYDTQARGIELIANEAAAADRNTLNSPLTAFLRANQVEVFAGDATQFIQELVGRYKPPAPPGAKQPRAAATAMPRGYSFVSYSRADIDRVRTFVTQLDQRNVKAWFDENEVTPGDNFSSEISFAIAEDSSAFVPILSKKALETDSRYFIREWRHALDVRDSKFDDVKFIFPVIIDDLDRSTAVELLKRRFPGFAEVHIEVCPDGILPDDRLVEELRNARKRFERNARAR